MGATESNFGLPEFDADAAFNAVWDATAQLGRRQETTLRLVGQWAENPECCYDDFELLKAAIETEAGGFEHLIQTYRESSLSEEEQNNTIANLLVAAKDKRVKFLSVMAPDFKFVDRRERKELVEELCEAPNPEETDSHFDDLDDFEDEDEEVDEVARMVTVYKDELQFDLSTFMEHLDEEEVAEEQPSFVSGVGKVVVRIASIAAGVYLGNRLSQRR